LGIAEAEGPERLNLEIYVGGKGRKLVKFWDTSAIVPLCVREPRSMVVKDILLEDPSAAVWWATRIECVSALARQLRDRGLSHAGARQAREVLHNLEDSWTEIQPTETLRDLAERLLAVHSLRAADSLQLAAALQWCQRQTKGATLVSFDLRLREAAHREGFAVQPAEPS
jgi:predicted nucleic acid-binding protein